MNMSFFFTVLLAENFFVLDKLNIYFIYYKQVNPVIRGFSFFFTKKMSKNLKYSRDCKGWY